MSVVPQYFRQCEENCHKKELSFLNTKKFKLNASIFPQETDYSKNDEKI